MHTKEIVTLQSTYREDMKVKGFLFGKGDKAACIVGSFRGNEIQQMYICSRLVQALRDLENSGGICVGKQILVIPNVNPYSMNVGQKFFGMEESDINRMFPGNEKGETTSRIAAALFKEIADYSYGIQFSSFSIAGEFAPHVRMMKTGYQNTSLANLFGLPYVVVKKPAPIDTKTLNYNWQTEMTAAFLVYTNKTFEIDDKSARQAVAAVLRFLTRMGILRYESHSGYISHVIMEEDLTNVYTECAGIFKGLTELGEAVRYGQPLAQIMDPMEGSIRQMILAPTDGIVFFTHKEALVTQYDMVYRLIHRMHE